MDITSRKLPVILIVALLAVLAVQYYSNTSTGELIDPQTCEIYAKDPRLNSRQYSGEFDQRCLDFKGLNNP